MHFALKCTEKDDVAKFSVFFTKFSNSEHNNTCCYLMVANVYYSCLLVWNHASTRINTHTVYHLIRCEPLQIHVHIAEPHSNLALATPSVCPAHCWWLACEKSTTSCWFSLYNENQQLVVLFSQASHQQWAGQTDGVARARLECGSAMCTWIWRGSHLIRWYTVCVFMRVLAWFHTSRQE